MKIVGIVCEYNPPHLGHARQIHLIRQHFGEAAAVVCIMSGNYVQRGEPAVLPKANRAGAALSMGADLVLELPVTRVLSSAEGFASGGVQILSRVCDTLCFGAETADADLFQRTAHELLSPGFSELLQQQLATGCSFPAARQAALEASGIDARLLSHPNDILGVEYCKAIAARKLNLDILPIPRHGDYHAQTADLQEPSATAVRRLMLSGENWQDYVPEAARSHLEGANFHSLTAAEGAILGRLRTMKDEEFEALPFGSEGLWRKFMAACRREATVEGILEATKSKRYTRTRLNRMLLCAWLGLTQTDLAAPVPYCRILAFNQVGRSILHEQRKSSFFVPVGQPMDHPFWAIEQRIADLYALSGPAPEPAGSEARQRILYLP